MLEEKPLGDIEDVEVRSFIKSLRDFKHLISAIDYNVATTLNSFVTNNEWHIFIPNHLLSVEYSFESIEFCACNFHFADAGTLLRKVRDDLLQFLMLYAMIMDINYKALSSSYEKTMDITAWIKGGFVLLHVFMKKTAKTPAREIEKAKAELADLIERGVEFER